PSGLDGDAAAFDVARLVFGGGVDSDGGLLGHHVLATGDDGGRVLAARRDRADARRRGRAAGGLVSPRSRPARLGHRPRNDAGRGRVEACTSRGGRWAVVGGSVDNRYSAPCTEYEPRLDLPTTDQPPTNRPPTNRPPTNRPTDQPTDRPTSFSGGRPMKLQMV